MSEKIPLRVPADFKYEFISQGNLSIDLTEAGSTIEVEDERFADWLVREQGFEDLRPQPETPAEDDPPPPFMPSFEEQYPEDFPGRAALIEAAIPIVTARNLDREQLIAINGIGAKTADAIIEYFASEEDGDENGGN